MKGALLLLAAVELLSFGLFADRAGFYHDDWTFLESMSRAEGFWDSARRLSAVSGWNRPVLLLLFPAFHFLGGLDPVVYQMLLLLLEVLQGWLFFILLDALLGDRRMALTAASLFLIYPNHAVTHVWFANSPQSFALTAVLASLVAYQRWLESRRRRWLAASLAAYMAGALCYESVVFLPLLLGGGLIARRLVDGSSARLAALESARDMAPYLPALLAVVLWQRLGTRVFFGEAPLKGVALSLRHVLEVMKAGFGCITYQAVRLCLRTAIPAWQELPRAVLLLWAPFTAALTAALVATPSRGGARSPVRIALGAALGGFIAANLPYALSDNYWPGYVGVMSRTSALGALSGGLLIAAGAAALQERVAVARPALLAAVIGAFTWCNWHTAWQWTLSWRLQGNILKLVERKVRALPGPATILLAGAPRNINVQRNEVVVFDASWDFNSALKLTTGRTDLSGDVVSPRMRFTRDGVVVESSGYASPPRPYKDLYLYRYDRDELMKLDKPPSPPPIRDF